jgi:hypothetical protein
MYALRLKNNNCRWCTPPNAAARAAVAAVDIKRGAAIIDYVGVVQTELSSRRNSSDDELDQVNVMRQQQQLQQQQPCYR